MSAAFAYHAPLVEKLFTGAHRIDSRGFSPLGNKPPIVLGRVFYDPERALDRTLLHQAGMGTIRLKLRRPIHAHAVARTRRVRSGNPVLTRRQSSRALFSRLR